MTPRERAEKYATKFNHNGAGSESWNLTVDALEEIIKDEIKMCAEVRDGIGTGLGFMANALMEKALSRIKEAKEAMAYEREECAKIADEFWDKHCQTEDGCFVNPSGAGKLAVREVARKIRLRGEKKQP